MEFLPQQNRRVSGEAPAEAEPILAGGKHVVVIGGGDTGSDCIGTSIRQGALSVTNFEILPAPPLHENKALTWPNWPLKLRTSSSHEEGAERDFAVMTTRFSGTGGFVKKLHCVHVDEKIQPIPGSDFEIDAELVLLAMGFVHPVHEGMIKGLNLALDQRGNVAATTDDYRTSLDKGVRRRRHAPRPVAGGLGDPRRPPGGARGRRVSDGDVAAAAVASSGRALALSIRRFRLPAFGGCPIRLDNDVVVRHHACCSSQTTSLAAHFPFKPPGTSTPARRVSR